MATSLFEGVRVASSVFEPAGREAGRQGGREAGRHADREGGRQGVLDTYRKQGTGYRLQATDWCVYTFVCVSVCVCMYVCMNVCMCVCMCVCM